MGNNALLNESLKDAAIAARFAELGMAIPSPPWDIDACVAFVRREREAWGKYIKLAKIEPQ